MIGWLLQTEGYLARKSTRNAQAIESLILDERDDERKRIHGQKPRGTRLRINGSPTIALPFPMTRDGGSGWIITLLLGTLAGFLAARSVGLPFPAALLLLPLTPLALHAAVAALHHRSRRKAGADSLSFTDTLRGRAGPHTPGCTGWTCTCPATPESEGRTHPYHM